MTTVDVLVRGSSAISHIMFHDANGNGQLDVGEISANVDRFFFTCA